MKLEEQLKLQAYLDGELAERETAEVRDWLARDADARALLAELTNTNAALSGHEAGMKLPESREFFWSKIEREIDRREQPVAPEAPELSWMMVMFRRLAPVGTVALLAGVMVLWLAQPKSPVMFGEMELTSDSMGAYTYRDQQERMTVVWFYDRKGDSEFTPVAAFASLDE